MALGRLRRLAQQLPLSTGNPDGPFRVHTVGHRPRLPFERLPPTPAKASTPRHPRRCWPWVLLRTACTTSPNGGADTPPGSREIIDTVWHEDELLAVVDAMARYSARARPGKSQNSRRQRYRRITLLHPETQKRDTGRSDSRTSRLAGTRTSHTLNTDLSEHDTPDNPHYP